MATHATLRTDYAEARLMGYLTGLSIAGSPTVIGSDVPGAADVDTPRCQVSFRPLDGDHAGYWDGTHTQQAMRLLVICDLWYPDGSAGESFNLYSPQQAAADLHNALSFLTLSFFDYSTPSSPLTVADAYLKVSRPVVTRRLESSEGLRRFQVRAVVEWRGRVENSFA